MKTTCRAILFAVCLGMSASALAFISFGTPDCEQWVKQHREPDKAWLLGFLSGLNGGWTFWVKKNSNELGQLDKISTEQVYLWMDNYCKANPRKYLSSGAQELFAELTDEK
jgi:hypothetical protein